MPVSAKYQTQASSLKAANEGGDIPKFQSKLHPLTAQIRGGRRNETIAEVSNEGGDSETPVSKPSVRHSQVTNAQMVRLSDLNMQLQSSETLQVKHLTASEEDSSSTNIVRLKNSNDSSADGH